MPDCAPAPSVAQAGANLQVVTAQRVEARKPARAVREISLVRFASCPARVPVLRVSLVDAPAASVPLFKAHCSFLI